MWWRTTMVVSASVLLAACPQRRPDSTPVMTCSREAPDICWSEAKAADEPQSPEAVAKFEIACQAEGFKHRALACTWAGLGLQSDPGQRPRAIEYHELACERGVQTSCAHLGGLLMQQAWSGDPGQIDPQLAEKVRTLVRPVCESEPLAGEEAEFGTDPRAYACSTLAPHFEHGFGVEENPQRSFEFWSRACELGSPQGCAQVGYFLARGLGVEADLEEASGYYRRSCENGSPMGCANLAALHLHGEGVPKDYERASELYATACERSYLDSCTRKGLADVLARTENDMSKRVDQLLALLDERAAKAEAELDDGDVTDKEWVKKKLATMFEVDQIYRKGFDLQQQLDDEQFERFRKELGERVMEVDERHLEQFKAIVEQWGWITRSEFDPMASDQAWLLVQHADRDVAFQAEILQRLEPLAEAEEIDPGHYAYLYDRVAVNEDREQRFGTQGRCVDGEWQPREMEAPDEVDERRAKYGLEPMAEYRKMFEGMCR